MTTTVVRTAQATSIFLSTLASGGCLALSLLLIPRLLESPPPPSRMLRQWQRSFAVTRVAFPLVAEAAAAGYYGLAWWFWRQQQQRTQKGGTQWWWWWCYLAAGLCCTSTGVYTGLVVAPTNGRIRGLIDAAGEQEPDERLATGLVARWGVLNVPRAVLLALGGGLGLVAAL